MDSGALCVMMVLVALMLTQCANSWDTQELQTMITSLACECDEILRITLSRYYENKSISICIQTCIHLATYTVNTVLTARSYSHEADDCMISLPHWPKETLILY